MEANYEIDFVGNNSSGNADAIAIRWKDKDGNYRVCVYDCGTEDQADQIIDLLNNYYFNESDDDEKIIDAIIISHPDGDHINGITKLMDAFPVRAMYFNVPWDYADELVRRSKNYHSADYLTSKLKKNYEPLSDIEDLAGENNIPIYRTFQGTIICGELLVLAPTEEDYIDHLMNSDKTPVQAVLESFSKKTQIVTDSWDADNLLEDPTTSEENETSVVISGLYHTEESKFLLLGDAGVVDIASALDYADDEELEVIEKTKFYQVPHHGGRHNLDTETMNRLVGNIKGESQDSKKVAYISVGKGSNHPRQCVVNAFKRRGVKVYKTEGNIIHKKFGDMPNRPGWTKLTELPFVARYEE